MVPPLTGSSLIRNGQPKDRAPWLRVPPVLLHRAKRNEAYMLCPLAGDLRVTNLLTQ
jgi:hypothetical protein